MSRRGCDYAPRRLWEGGDCKSGRPQHSLRPLRGSRSLERVAKTVPRVTRGLAEVAGALAADQVHQPRFQWRMGGKQVADARTHRAERLGDEQAVERRIDVKRDL